MLGQATQSEDECLHLARSASSCCFYGGFVLEEEFFGVRFPVELGQYCRVKPMGPLYFLQFLG